ncbi:glycosyltransferase family 2 protein, partial [Dysgonomonas sp. Marseille-P4677]|uniref:glycosyltransferase family 2 protein n=1 Tax=Dysgonomonas sp. Marseille-P4677 TaxID=2364790 RepID=UPI00191474B5
MKKNIPRISIIISTYNWPDALRLCLQSITCQTILPDEVVIADDGSKESTTELIVEMRKSFPCPIVHVWHEDKGFRLTVIRNKAIVKSTGDYILQIDGDIILNKHFVEDHLKFAKENCFATGSRIMLSSELTRTLLEDDSISINLWTRGLKNKQNSIRNVFLASYFRFRYKKDSPYYIKGCNMAFWKKDLITVNGYNEDMTGWGYEDNEISARLIASGVRKQYLKFSGIVYHLYHRSSSHERENINSSIFKNAITNK